MGHIVIKIGIRAPDLLYIAIISMALNKDNLSHYNLQVLLRILINSKSRI